jgi:NAD(P)-binding Rossmann-like domain
VGRVRDTGEAYDCVIVGAGASGIASAKWYRDRFGEDSRILLIDPLPDFGGHHHRNEFHIPNAAAANADVMLLRYGGAINLDSIGTWNKPAGSPAVGYDIPGAYGQPALDMLAYLGVIRTTSPTRAARGSRAPTGCARCCCSRSRLGRRPSGWRVHAMHVVMACWNRVTARLVDGLPGHQVKDLDYARKVPLIYGRAGLNNWQAFADAKISSVSPRGNSLFWDSTSLVAGQVFGSAYGPTPNDPAAPAMLQFTCVPTDPTRLTPAVRL